MVDGARVGGGERELHLGQVYAVNPQQLPTNAHYIALGHLHRPQEVAAASMARYAGSLLQLDFGEKEQGKGVVIVDAHPGRPARAEPVAITAGRRLRDLEGTLAELRALAPEVDDDYLRVRVKVDGPLPHLAEQVREILPNAVEITPVYSKQDEQAQRGRERLGGLSPAELLASYHQETYGSEVPEAVAALFRRLLTEVEVEHEAP